MPEGHFYITPWTLSKGCFPNTSIQNFVLVHYFMKSFFQFFLTSSMFSKLDVYVHSLNVLNLLGKDSHILSLTKCFPLTVKQEFPVAVNICISDLIYGDIANWEIQKI